MAGKILSKMIGHFTGHAVSELPACPLCGSTSVIVSGNSGLNRRHDCISCGSSTWIDHY